MERQTIPLAVLSQKMPDTIDKLPSPAEFRPAGATRGTRYRWVGFGWVEEGPADGSEPLLVEEPTACCPACQKRVDLDAAGRMPKHYHTGGRIRRVCGGSRMTPAEVEQEASP